MIVNRNRLLYILVFVIFLGGAAHSNASSTENEHGESSFSAGDFILDHIGDAYEWHITGTKEKHISIPLPVILHSKTSGWHVFMSSKFHHGHESYNGFEIAHEGDYKGKIVELMADGTQVKPFDLSMTKNVISLLFSLSLILWIFISVANAYKRNRGKAPSGLQSWLEPLILFIRDDVAKESIGEKRYKKYTPFLLTIFFFIFINNLLGLVPVFPGGANLTGNITITMALAVITFLITTFSGNKGYWVHMINTPGVPWWLKFPLPLMPIVEISGMFIKPFVLMVRLFANITAGHIIALGFYSLIFIFGNISEYAGLGVSPLTIAFTVFMTLLEILVAFIQAYVFTLLSALYFGMATEEHH